MPVLEDLKAYLLEKDPDVYGRVHTMIDDFSEEESKKYRENKEAGKLTWGKYKGYSVKELNMTEKGKDYLRWMIGQDWVKQNKPHIVEQIKELGIKPKKFTRTPLEWWLPSHLIPA